MAVERTVPPGVPGRFLISDLCALLERYLPAKEVALVYEAYLFSAEAHDGQRRLSGEPYIFHPLSVARILAELRLDADTVAAAILHDVIEDTPVTEAELGDRFGEEIARLVDGVSKLTQVDHRSRAEAQAENFRKMLLAMVDDVRVILIKLADRLHNMRTLGAVDPVKRRRIARETLEIFAPIANRLGINSIRLELEDRCFAAIYPLRFRVLSEAVRKTKGHRSALLEQVEQASRNRLEEEGVRGHVFSREKHLYSLYQKMRLKRMRFDEVLDVFALRLVVERVDDCYRALGILHNLYKPLPGRFKDYVALPKNNGYQSLHTVLFGPSGIPIEAQIRTKEMDLVAESGIAAHAAYKEADIRGESRTPGSLSQWLRGLLEIQRNAGNSVEFLEHVKVDLFPEEVFLFTPRGEIRELPKGATPVDFAYAVHTDVGNSCVAAKVERRWAALNTPLKSGQTIEVITAPDAHPNPAWLNFVVTAKARSNIRYYLKGLRQHEAEALGQRLLRRALADQNLSLEQLAESSISALLAAGDYSDLKALYRDLGLGNRPASMVVLQLSGVTHSSQTVPLSVNGGEGPVLSYARCCRPIPGDPILGHLSAGRGIVVHRVGCRNTLEPKRSRGDQWIELGWDSQQRYELPAEICVEVKNQRGVLATVAGVISDQGSNIDHVEFDEKDGVTTRLAFLIVVRDREQLARIIRQVGALESVLRIWRIANNPDESPPH